MNKIRYTLLLLIKLLALSSLSAVADNNEAEFLDVDKAFVVSVSKIENSQLNVDFKIADGHYLYKKRVAVVISKPFSIVELLFPDPDTKNDPSFGVSEVYHRGLLLPVKLAYEGSLPEKAVVEVSYQGCSEKGLCYPPMVKSFPIDVINADQVKKSNLSEQIDDGAALLGSGNFILIGIGFFGFGLLLSLTPCVFPMIPILSGIIVGQSDTSKGHSFLLSLAYVLGMALSYTVAGILAALTGDMVSAALQNAWVLGSFSLVFVALSLSMFGFYELQLPSALGSNLNGLANRIKGGRFAGVFLMGALSALIVSPCVAAPLAGALIYISQTHNVILGGLALFSLSLGMGVPLLIIGASAGALLPKAGAWMDAVKNFFGVLMLAVAIWLVAPIVPHYLVLFLASALMIFSAVYLGSLETVKEGASGWQKFRKALGVIILLLGTLLLFASFKSSGLIPDNVANTHVVNKDVSGLVFKRIANVEDLNNEIEKSKNSFVMLDFYADWCAACKEYENGPFKDPSVMKALENVVLLQADVTANSEQDKMLMKKFGLFGPPGIIFFDKNGKEVLKVIGYKNVDVFNTSIKKVISSN
jgi:thiol:disulfide interchange protein DsbD